MTSSFSNVSTGRARGAAMNWCVFISTVNRISSAADGYVLTCVGCPPSKVTLDIAEP